MVEEALASYYVKQEIRCPMHLCIGQEAIAVGVISNLNSGDIVFSNHRAHGHYLAKGGSLNAMIAELFGRETGCCGGRGGSMHMIDESVGFLGATPIVGGTIPLAVGSAWASSLLLRDEVTVVFFGDGCFEEGVIHEAMNFAALHKLPILFVCENNNFSVYTSLKYRQPNREIYKIAAAHGLKSNVGDGNDIEVVYEISKFAIDAIRNGDGPQFLEFTTYRWKEHCGPNYDDELNYRSIEEIQAGLSRCPILKVKANLFALSSFSLDDILEMENEIKNEIEASFDFALKSRMPTVEDAQTYVYA